MVEATVAKVVHPKTMGTSPARRSPGSPKFYHGSLLASLKPIVSLGSVFRVEIGVGGILVRSAKSSHVEPTNLVLFTLQS